MTKAQSAAAQEGVSPFEVSHLQSEESVWKTPRRTKIVTMYAC